MGILKNKPLEDEKKVSNPRLVQIPVKKGPIVLPKVLQLNNKLFEKHILPYVKPLKDDATEKERDATALKLLEIIHANRNNGGLAGIRYEEGINRTIKSPNEVLTPNTHGELKADCDELAFLYIAAAERLNLGIKDFSILEIKFVHASGNTNHAVVLNIKNEIFELTTGEVVSSIKGKINNEKLNKVYAGKPFNKKIVISVSLISNSKGVRGIGAAYYETRANDMLREGKIVEAVESFESTYKLQKNKRRREAIIKNSFFIVDKLLKRKNYKTAEKYLKKILKYEKTNAEAHYDLGVCYSETGDEVKAITEFKKATLTWDKELRKNALL